MSDSTLEYIEVSRLRVGMFVHIDNEAASPAFMRSGFLIKNETQLAQVRGLGLAKVRYSPKRSEVRPLSASPDALSWVSLGVPGFADASAVSNGGTKPADNGADNLAGPTAQLPEPDSAAVAAASSEVANRRLAAAARRAILSEQQASIERCELQFNTMSRQLRSVLQMARSNPTQARQAVAAQVDSMVEQTSGIDEIAIRLLSEKAGQETTLHPMNVGVLSILLGRALRFDTALLAQLGLGALLHDIGKLELPDRLRWRNDQLPAAERRLFQSHVAHGVVLAKKMELPTAVIDVIAQHHEYANGSGYPQGLKGEQITPSARIVALVNQYDNLCNPGNPAQAMTPHDALAVIFARQRDAFDAAVLAAFIRMMGVYPPGSVLQLSDQRFAIVVSVNSERPLKPRIIIHEPEVPADEAIEVDLEHQPEIDIQRAIKPLQLPRAVFDYLSPRKRMCYFFERSMSTQTQPPQ